MDELKLLIEMVANLPTLAVWVLVGYLVYKVAVIGSIYGVIRLLIVKAHDWLTAPRQMRIGTRTLDAKAAEELQVQINRLSTHNYISSSDVQNLKQALDAHLAKK